MIAAALVLATVATAPSPRYLVAIGHNRGLPAEVDLRYAERDATHFTAVMQTYGGVSRANSRTLTGPTVADVETTLEALTREVRKKGERDAILLFYYSGHADDVDLHLGAERWARGHLAQRLAGWPGKLTVAVIDACRGQADIAEKGFSKVPRFAVDVAPQGLRGGVTLRSSSSGEASQESEQLQGAIYTHYLLTGLRGAADEDGDHRVTLEEAYLYAYQQSVRRSAAGPGNVMHPSVQIDLRGAGALVLTETHQRSAMLVLPPDRDALYLIYRQPSGRLLAEVRAGPLRATRVAVPAGDYLVQRRVSGSKRGGAKQMSVEARTEVEIDVDSFAPVPFEILAAKGGHLEIWSHELTASGGGLVSHAATFGPRLRLRYGLIRGAWGVDASVDLGRFDDADTFNDRVERWVGGDMRLQHRGGLGPLHLSVGFAWRMTEQSLTRKGADSLAPAGFDTDARFTGFSAGPTLGAAWEWTLSPRWFMRLVGVGTTFVRREGDEWRLRPEAGVEFGLGFVL